MTAPGTAVHVKESRHLWVGGLPDTIDEPKIKEYFTRFGKVEGVKILPQKYPKIGLAAFVDFYDVRSAVEAKEAKHKLNGQELRTNFKAKQSEKFGDSGPKKSSDDEQEDVNEQRSHPGSESDGNSSSSDESKSDDKGKKKKESLMLKISGLPKRSERVLQDGLYYEYTRYSPSVEIKMYGNDAEKWAVAKFKKADKCQEARKQTQGIVLFGNKIKVTQLDGNDFPPGGRDEPAVPSSGTKPLRFEDMDPQATRSLFVGNIPKNISVYEVRDAFQRYGNILDVEIKKMGGTATYGFVLYYDLSSAITAKKYMDGQSIKGNNIRVGFGKGTNSKQLWIDGVDSNVSRQQLERHMSKYGNVVRLGIDYPRNCAMVQYDSIESAKEALDAVKGSHIGNSRKLMTDFANRDARAAFFAHMERMEMEGSHQPYPGPGMYGPGMMEPGYRGGMMIPGGMPMMGMGRPGYHPQGPPMDYMYDPYMDGGMGYFGGRPPFHHGRGHPVPMGMGSFHGGQYEDDYEEELAAYKRKRDWEKEREKRKSRKKPRSSSSDSSSESDDSSHKKRKKDKHRKSGKKQKHKGKKTEDSDNESSSDEEHNESRLKATKRSKEHRERAKKKSPTSKSSDASSDSKKKRKERATSKSDSQDEEPKALKSKSKPDKGKKSKPPSPPVSPTPPGTPRSDSKPDNKPVEPPSPNHPSKEVRSDRRVSSASSVEGSVCKSSVDDEPTSGTPQSPPTKKMSAVQVESDWSSGDDFKGSDNDKASEHKSPVKNDDSSSKHTDSGQGRHKRSSNDLRSPSDNEQEDRAIAKNKPTKNLPRKYQVDEVPDISRKEPIRYRDPRPDRYRSGPSSPSPPHSGHGSHRRRAHYSPPPEQYERHRYRKPRQHSPPRGHRRHSRSPHRFQSPGYKGKSPSPRPRSPPLRSKEIHSRYRHESPSGDPPRGGRYSRRGSPHSPSHRHQHSTSPPFPRSPVSGRKRPRHHTPSASPPRRSPGRGYKRDKSPGLAGGRGSPRYKKGLFSRTPSPKAKYRDTGVAKEEVSEFKRRRVEDPRPKSPPANPPPSKGAQSSYPGHHTQTSSVAAKADTSSQHSPRQRSVEQSTKVKAQSSDQSQTSTDNLLDLLRRYPVMWQGHLTLKNDSAAVQLHFLCGNVQLAKMSLPQPSEQHTPTLRIAQRMRLEKTQLEGVSRRMQADGEHCLLLALPCGRDASDVHLQTNALKNTFITYLIQKQAAGIINVPGASPQSGYVLHIFPPCPFSQVHLSRVAPDLLSSASDNCHLMIVVATM